MAKKGFIKDLNNIEILPITRGELILDSSGNLAFHSNEFLATDSLPGLMSKEDKAKLDNFHGNGTTIDLVSTTTDGLAPKIGTEAASTVTTQADEWVLTSTKGATPTWRKLPTNAFLNYYRPIQINGTTLLENNNTALNIVAGNDINLETYNNVVRINNSYKSEFTVTQDGWYRLVTVPAGAQTVKEASNWKDRYITVDIISNSGGPVSASFKIFYSTLAGWGLAWDNECICIPLTYTNYSCVDKVRLVTKAGIYEKYIEVYLKVNPESTYTGTPATSLKVFIDSNINKLYLASSAIAGITDISGYELIEHNAFCRNNKSVGGLISEKAYKDYNGNIIHYTYATISSVNNIINGITPVGSANKLTKPVKLWGQEFDGSNDVSGKLLIESSSWNNYLELHRTDSDAGAVAICFYNTSGLLGSLGVHGSGGAYPLQPVFINKKNQNYKIWHSGNLTNLSQLTDDVVSGKYLPLSGGTLSGDLKWEPGAGQKSLFPGHYYHNFYPAGPYVYIHFYPNTQTTSYAIFRTADAVNDTFKELIIGGDGKFTWDNKKVLHEGNYNNYAPKLDGTGATGNWNINITGNSATADKLKTKVKLWGNDFDGDGDVNGTIIIKSNAGIYYYGDDSTYFGYAGHTYINHPGMMLYNVISDTIFKLKDEKGAILNTKLELNGYLHINTNNALMLNALSSVTTYDYVTTALFLLPNLLTGHSNCILWGKALASGQSAGLVFKYNEDKNENLLSLGFYSDVYKFNIKGNGNVGIGTMTPMYKLDVNGNTNINGSLTATTFLGNLDWSYITNKPTSFIPEAHDHKRIISSDDSYVGIEAAALPSSYAKGVTFNTCYSASWPTIYGNVLTLRGRGDSQIYVSWSAGQTLSVSNVKNEIYFRSKRDAVAGDKWSDWTRVITDKNYSEYCALKTHNHTSDQIIALTGYTKATSASDLVTTDTLNTALGKLEYKADIAYSWYRTITEDDTDEIINKWDEVVDFINGLEVDLLDEFVTRKTALTITGTKTFSSPDWGKSLIVHRDLDTYDSVIQFSNRVDGILGYIGIGGSDSTSSKLNPYWSNGTNAYKFWHAGNDGSGSGLDADLLDGVDSANYMKRVSRSTETEFDLDTYTDFACKELRHSNEVNTLNAPLDSFGLLVNLRDGDSHGKFQFALYQNLFYFRGYQNDANVLDNTKTVWNELIHTGNYHSLTAAKDTWNATILGNTWSRLCRVYKKKATIGSSYIMTITATRNTVVYHKTYLVHVTHPSAGNVVQLGGDNYDNGIISVRVCTDNGGDSFFEIKESRSNFTSDKTQQVLCTLISLCCGESDRYTNFVSGEVLETGFSAGTVLTSKVYVNSILASTFVGNLIGNVTGNLTGNATSATRLQTPRKLWGNDFDGTSDVDGNIRSTQSEFRIYSNTDTELLKASATGSYINIAYGAVAKLYTTYVYGKNIHFKTDITTDVKMAIANNGNVGIGTTNPEYTLDVHGTIRLTSSLNLSTKSAMIKFTKADGTLTNSIQNDVGNLTFDIGYGHRDESAMQLFGTSVALFNGNTRVLTAMNSNVLIGTLTDNGHKLNVNGNVFVSSYINFPNTEKLKGIVINPTDVWTYKIVDTDGTTTKEYKIPHYSHAMGYYKYIHTNGTSETNIGSFISDFFGLKFHVGRAEDTFKFGYGSGDDLVWGAALYGDGHLRLQSYINIGESKSRYIALGGADTYTWIDSRNSSHNVMNSIIMFDNETTVRNLRPQLNNSFNLGTTSYRWANVYADYGDFVNDISTSKNLVLRKNGSIYWSTGSWWLRLSIGDDSTANTTVFMFEQSSDTGKTWNILTSIYDNGNIHSTGFIKTNSSDSYVLLGGGGHKALSDFMLKSDELTNNVTTITKELTVTQDWMDTGIVHKDIPESGTYIVLVGTIINNGTDSMWDCFWSGVMTWFVGIGRTNDSETDEIILHRSGHAYNNTIYLRTVMTSGGSSSLGLKLLIAANKNLSAAYTFTFKFKRIL